LRCGSRLERLPAPSNEHRGIANYIDYYQRTKAGNGVAYEAEVKRILPLYLNAPASAKCFK
jgi:hypothetical protein